MTYKEVDDTIAQTITIQNLISETDLETQRNELIKGLTSENKYISSKYFYDKKGSELFEEITKLEEYYPTKTELSILKDNAEILTKNFSDTKIIELGSGDCSKIMLLLNAMKSEQIKTSSYIPVDVSYSAIKKSTKQLSEKFPDLKIKAITADFMHHSNFIPDVKNKVICFFGSTIGNLNRSEATDFIKNTAKKMSHGDIFLLGADMVKDIEILENAYNDKLKITAAFNKNILNHVNKLLKTDFKPDIFEHIAFFNKKESRIEMHLKAKTNMQISSPFLKEKIKLKKNENIHTENSHKYTKERIREFAEFANLKITKIYTDKNQLFSLVQFIKL